MIFFLEPIKVIVIFFFLHFFWVLIFFPSKFLIIIVTVDVIIMIVIKGLFDFSMLRVKSIRSTDLSVDTMDETVLENVDRNFIPFAVGKFVIVHFGKEEAFDLNSLLPDYLVHAVAIALAWCKIDSFVEGSIVKGDLTFGFIDTDLVVVNVQFSVKEYNSDPIHFGFEPA